MRGSLRLRHCTGCPAGEDGRQRDARACRCSPAVQARVAGVHRSLGHLPRGSKAADVIPFEARLVELRGLVLEGRPPAPRRVMTTQDVGHPDLTVTTS